MTDTPGNQDLLSLDEAIDDLLSQATPSADAPSETSGSATESHLAPASDVAPPPDHGDTPHPSGADASTTADAPIEDALASSLDQLLKQANELQASVAEVAPRVESAVPPPPTASADTGVRHAADERTGEPDPPAPSATTPASGVHESSRETDTTTLQSLDAELAALTDDLLAGEIESGAPEPDPASAPSADPAPRAEETAPSATPAAAPSPFVPASAHQPATARAESPSSSATNAQAAPSSGAIKRLLAGALGAAARPVTKVTGALLAILGAPLKGKRTLQQSIGWLASYTLFLAGGLWIYLLAFHSPEKPHAVGAPSSLHGDDHHADPHNTDPHGTDAHGAESHGEPKPGGGASHDKSDKNTAHGEADAGHGSAGGAKSGAAHGSDDAHAAGPARVVNGFAISKAAAAKKDGAKPGAKKDDGHGAKKDDGHGAKKSGGH